MPADRSLLGVALVAGGRPAMLAASLHAHAEAVRELQTAGAAAATVVLVDRTDTPQAAEVLTAISGVEKLPAGAPGESEAAALARAADALPRDVRHILLSGTDAAPSPGAFVALLDAARRTDADLVLAGADEPAPYGLMSERVRELLDALDASAPPLLALARAVRAAGGRVVEADGAGQALRDTISPAASYIKNVDATLADPGAVQMGFASYFGRGSRIVTWAPLERIRIGAYCSFADEVRLLHPGATPVDRVTGEPAELLLRGSHRMASATTYPIDLLVPDAEDYDELPTDGSLVSPPLSIGSDVWIGAGALVLGAVTIGHGAVIGAGCVVTKDVRPYDVVAGNPATTIRRRFDDRTCARLLAVRWWEWDPGMVLGNHLRFTEPVADFLDRFDPAGSLDA